MCRGLGIETDDRFIPQIASGFGGGIGNTGSVCGSVVGGVMAIGLKRGRATTMEASLETASLVQEFRRRFEAEMGTIECRALTGADLTTKDGIEAFMDSDTPATVCFPAVETAYRVAMNLLGEPS